jgi:hypothetical protein
MKHNDPSHRLLEDADELGHEARAGSGDHAALKLWLRMLSCTTHIESEIRRRLRERFDMSLAPLRLHGAALPLRRRPEDARPVALPDGHRRQRHRPHRRPGEGRHGGAREQPGDRRAWIVRLTAKGRRRFETMAREHEGWLLELFSGLDAATVRQLSRPARAPPGAPGAEQRILPPTRQKS